jgi:iron complex transport system ATP-binding protein
MLSFENLSFGYPKRRWQLPENIKLEGGQIVALLGRNGAGKSTFLRTLARQLPILNGNIYIDNYVDKQDAKNQESQNQENKSQEIRQFSIADYAQKVAVVRTEKIHIPYCSLRQLVAFGRLPHSNYWGELQSSDWQKVDETLARFGLEALAERISTDLSDGELQLALLARAIAQDCPILLLDEITSHLDFINRRLVFEQLAILAKEENKLVIIASHELELVLQYSQELLIFAQQKATQVINKEVSISDILRFWR